LIDAAEFEAGAAAGFGERHAGVNQLLYVLIEMEAELGVEFTFDFVAAE
jgi:hypothetical protein